MESMDEILSHLIKTQYELDTGTYKLMSNEERLRKFNKELQKQKKMYKSNNLYEIKQTCTTDCKVGSTNKSFNTKMKPITIKEMTMGNTYKDRYIKFEIVTELHMIVSIMFLGKDDNGDFVLIAVYNFENHYGTKDYKQLSYIFQKGKYIIVLEPFYKMFGSGEDGIRIEDPNEIIIFDDKEWMDKFISAENKEESFKLLHDEDDKTYDSLYKEAFKSFSIQNYKMALVHFIKLKTLKPEEEKFDMKIAECYFEIPFYSKVIEKCDEIINNSKNENFKINALSLKLKSLIKLKKIKEAKDVIDINKNIIIQYESQFFLIEEEIKRKMKDMKGEFDLGEIYEKSKDEYNIDMGEYINPKLEIIYDKIKGISIFTKEKISKGEILVLSKALISSRYNNKLKDKDDKNICIQYDNPDKDEFEKTGRVLTFNPNSEIQNKLSYNLSNYAEDYSEFLYLFDGKNKNLTLEERLKQKETDLKKIQRVLKYNTKLSIFVDEPISEGVWFYPSLFNHSCIPNCHSFGIGDMLIIISINDTEKNNELYLNYLNNDLPFNMRQNLLKEKYDFDCCCELCNYEKNKFKNCPEKSTLDKYVTQLHEYLFENKENNNINCPSEKEIKVIIKFLEKNKKLFSCYERSTIYVYCALCMKRYDGYLACDYLECALKYSENRNYEYEKLSLRLSFDLAKALRSDVRLEIIMKKIKDFYEKYFSNQKKLRDILIRNYKI